MDSKQVRAAALQAAVATIAGITGTIVRGEISDEAIKSSRAATFRLAKGYEEYIRTGATPNI